MRLLLDTHVFIWMHAAPERLSKKARELLVDADQKLFLSVASAWELGIKVARGQLSLPNDLEEYVLSRSSAARIAILPIELSHVFEAAALPAHHRDPFDRMLVAQARVEDLTLISGDPWLSRYEVARVPA
jgi:PIN domain nuclease of toxin-antitoxin system